MCGCSAPISPRPQVLSTQLLLGCVAAAETDKQVDVSDSVGLAKGRTYSLLDARWVALGGGGAQGVSQQWPGATQRAGTLCAERACL